MNTRQVIAGAGTTGGGALSGDVTIDVIANADASIVVNANDIQVGVLASDAQHGVRGGGTQHAVATEGLTGFLASTKYDALFRGKNRKIIFDETFEGAMGSGHIVGEATGSGATAGFAVAAGYLSVGRAQTGTTNAGMGRYRTTSNWIYNGAILFLRGDTVGEILALSTGSEEFDFEACSCHVITGNGFSIMYRRTQSVNWQLVEWNGTTPTFTDTGVPVTTGSHRFEFVYDRAAATVTFTIDGVAYAALTTIPTFSAEYYVAAQITKTVGTTGREMYIERAFLEAEYTVARPG